MSQTFHEAGGFQPVGIGLVRPGFGNGAQEDLQTEEADDGGITRRQIAARQQPIGMGERFARLAGSYVRVEQSKARLGPALGRDAGLVHDDAQIADGAAI